MANVGVKFEDYVAELLSRLGLKVLGRRVKVTVNGVEVGEVDIVAEDGSGNRYAIEVKSGKVDVSAIRQAYVNAKVLNAKPLIVARGFSNDSSRALADELGVSVINLEEAVVLTIDELRTVIENVIYEAVGDLINTVFTLAAKSCNSRVRDIMGAVMECNDWSCVCEKLGVNVDNCGSLISDVRRELGLGNLSLSKLKTAIRLYNLISLLINSCNKGNA
ncbi:endonuclease NucS [Vulcanisaeta sp. JCM 16161]|uniref:restriction endonuclease n=1 Tax=Vulcanisaeta sp. JCM 16161 TaxID=1295372 RepID=UPI0006CFD4DE|nr:restriction endonuclease [Vulcanisaeta sp. JCM 16161]